MAVFGKLTDIWIVEKYNNSTHCWEMVDEQLYKISEDGFVAGKFSYQKAVEVVKIWSRILEIPGTEPEKIGIGSTHFRVKHLESGNVIPGVFIVD